MKLPHQCAQHHTQHHNGAQAQPLPQRQNHTKELPQKLLFQLLRQLG